MSQFDDLGQIPNADGASVRADINAADGALASMNAGTTAPTTTYAWMDWVDTTAGMIKRRDAANTGWEIVQNYSATTNPGTGDDSGDGYVRGSVWINTTGDSVWICADPSAAAAVWIEVGSGAGGGGGGLTVLADHADTSALTLTTDSVIAATDVPSSTTLPAISGADHQIVLVNRSGSAITVARNGSDTINVDGSTGQTTVSVPDNSTIAFHVDSTLTEWHAQVSNAGGEVNTTSSGGSGLSILGTTPKSLATLIFRGIKALAAGSSIAIAHDDTNNDIDFSLTNDDAAPGNYMVYGTDASSVKGWQARQVGVPAAVLTGVSGSLTTAAHCGAVLVTSGNVTIPNAAGDVGFRAVIVSGGSHTVTFNSLTSAAMAAGDVMTLYVESTTVIHAVLTAAADKVSFS